MTLILTQGLLNPVIYIMPEYGRCKSYAGVNKLALLQTYSPIDKNTPGKSNGPQSSSSQS